MWRNINQSKNDTQKKQTLNTQQKQIRKNDDEVIDKREKRWTLNENKKMAKID